MPPAAFGECRTQEVVSMTISTEAYEKMAEGYNASSSLVRMTSTTKA